MGENRQSHADCLSIGFKYIMLKILIKYLAVWRLATLAVAFLAAYTLPLKDCCQSFGKNIDFNYLTQIWANFAGSDFLDLAKFNYGPPLEKGTYILFPLFPWLIGEVTRITSDYLASGLLIAHLSLILALLILYRLVKLDFKENIARLTLTLLMIFPTSFFFGSVYTESFFLLLVVLTFYLTRKNYLLLACLTALFASATRFAGIFLWPAIIWEVWQGHDRKKVIWLLLPQLGLLSYMKYLSERTGDALYFLKVSPDFGPNLVISKVILLHQVFYRYAKMILFSSHTDISFAVIILELVIGVLCLVLTIIAFRKLRFSYALFLLLSYLIPTFTGTFVSQPRYLLTAFPGFILLALWFSKQGQLMKRFYIALNVIFAIIMIALFTRGYFIG